MYSGNDNLLLPFLSLGGDGCISVASNIIPKVMKKIYVDYINGETENSRKMFLRYLKMFDELFSCVNPVPIKRCAELMGLCSGEIRLPLTEYEGNGMEKLLKEYSLI
jgi:4-hydroxy-tetrahydrodipicolinate synthase